MTRPRVLVDARKARDFGIGSYIRGLLGGLARQERWDLVRDSCIRATTSSCRRASRPSRATRATTPSRELFAVRGAIARLKPGRVPRARTTSCPSGRRRATVVTIHDLMHLNRPEHGAPWKRAYAKWMVGRALRLSARVIAVSEATKEEILAFGPEQGGKVVVIPNGVREDFFEWGGEETATPRPDSLSKEISSYLLFLGNDKPHKNLEGLLARVAARARRRIPGSRSSSRASSPGASCPRARRPSGSCRTRTCPRSSALAEALVLPSFAEGFGLPVLEAQAAGTPVACSDLPALHEARRRGGGLLQPPRRRDDRERAERAARG